MNRYILRTANGDIVGGDNVLDQALKDSAARQDAQIIDTQTGEVVYDGIPEPGIELDQQ